jgi:GNAT superfamily N-acetyltransferase
MPAWSVEEKAMSTDGVTRRNFLGGVAALAAPSILPPSLFGNAAPDSLSKIDEYWAGYFGCSPRDLKEPRTLVLPHRALARCDRVLVFRHGASCIVSVPHFVPEIERSRLRAAGPEEACDPRFLSRVFLVDADRIRGPVGLAFADRGASIPMPSEAGLLEDAYSAEIESLVYRCKKSIWYRLMFEPYWGPTTYGILEGSRLVAMSSYLVFGELFASIGALVDPERRGRGLGKKVVHAAMKGAFEKGLIPALRTALSDEPVVALGRSLGFRPYAFTMDVQLCEEEF